MKRLVVALDKTKAQGIGRAVVSGFDEKGRILTDLYGTEYTPDLLAQAIRARPDLDFWIESANGKLEKVSKIARDRALNPQMAFTDLLAQHQMFSHRAATQVVNESLEGFGLYAKRLRAEVVSTLDTMNEKDLRQFVMGKYGTAKSKRLRDAINVATDKYIEEFGALMDKTGRGYIEYEAKFMMDSVTAMAAGYEAVLISGSAIYTTAMNQPIVGYLFDKTLKDMSENTKKRVFASMRANMSNGATNTEIINSVFGTKQFKYADGVMNTTKASIERTVRTVRNHLATEAYDAVYDALGVERVIFQSILDGRTSDQCASLSGTIYDRNKPHPQPPLHPHCRSLLVIYDEKFVQGMQPAVRVNKDKDGKFKPIAKLSQKKRDDLGYKVQHVKSGTPYSTWFARQDASFQRDWLGATRYDLYKKGDLSFDRFTDTTGRKLTLAELKIKDAEAFKRAGL